MFVEIDKINVNYGKKTILHNISLNLAEGEVVGIIGPNGSGKSTLLKAISGVARLNTGKISILGQYTSALSQQDLARLVAVVSQSPTLPMTFKAKDIVLMGRTPHVKLLHWENTHDIEEAYQAMELTQTIGLAERFIGELSGGERQRILIARALAQETPVLLLDEPTASLDLGFQIRVMDLLSTIRTTRNLAMIIAMHDLTLAASYCDRLIMLNDGRIFHQGTSKEVLTRKNISPIYNTEISILCHPIHRTPVVLPISGGKSGNI